MSTAGWGHPSAMVWEPHAHRQVPRVDMFLLPGGRLRRPVVRSGQRELFFYLDLAVPGLRCAAEYDGEDFHGPERLPADLSRRAWLTEHDRWRFGIFVAADVRGDGQIASERLVRDIGEARRTFALRRRVVT